jgi:hypothetical protein
MSTITVNTSDLELIRARQSLAASFGSLDAKRPAAWDQFGYRENLTFDDCRMAYERGAVGHGAVHRLLDGCWQILPRIKATGDDKETPWEGKVSAILKAINGWAKLRDFDRRNMVGRYAGLIYRVADGLPLDQPVGTAAKLVDLVPVYEDQLKVMEWHSDSADAENFGKPAMFQYRRRVLNAVDGQGRPDEWQNIHPSRVQLMAEGSVGDFLEGVPVLKAGFNSLVDLEKIGGGSAESFLKNSARSVTFSYDAGATPITIGADGEKTSAKSAHEAQVRALNSNIDAAIVTQGATVGTLQTTVSDPTGAFLLAAKLFAASIRLPFAILFGQQTGVLASDQDKADAVARYKSRQANELTPMLEEFVKRMQAIGAIDRGEFEIYWEDIAAPSDKEKLENAKALAAINTEAFRAGMSGDMPFTSGQIREAAGFDQAPADVVDPMPQPE